MGSSRKAGAQLVELFDKALKAAKRVEVDEENQAEETRSVEALKALRRVAVTTAILMDTQVGKRLRKLTKHKSSRICSIAQELMDAWKKVVAKEAAAHPKNASTGAAPAKKVLAKESLRSRGLMISSPSLKPPSKVEKVVKIERTEENKTAVTTSADGATEVLAKESLRSPGLMISSPSLKPPRKVEKVVKTERTGENKTAVTTSANGATKVLAKESLRSPAVMISSPSQKPPSKVEKVVKTERTVETKSAVSTTSANGATKPAHGHVLKCGDPIRDRIRERLAEAFSMVVTEAEDEYMQKAKASDIGRVAAAVERGMFRKLGLSNGVENKGRYRSLIFNLRDANNPDLRRRVLMGEIAPEKLLTMSVEDMASDQRKQEIQHIKDKALFECERGLKQAASTDQFKCTKCNQRQCTYFQMQTRSADEPMTTFVTCVNCNNHWMFC